MVVHFPGADTAVLGPLSTEFRKGEFVSLVGPSGCGKSTLLRLVAGLLEPSDGSVLTDFQHSTSAQENGVSAGTRIGFVFQQPTLLPWRTALQNLSLPLELGPRTKSRTASLSDAQKLDLLQQVGLGRSDADKRPNELSGGMQMRLSLARALAVNPQILLLDEPLAAVDDLLRLRLQEDVRRVHDEQHLTTILVTHNLHEAVFLSDRVLVLGGHPTRILQDVGIPCEQPRTDATRNSPQFHELVRQLGTILFAA